MPTIAKLVVRLSLNDSQYKKGIDSAIKQAQAAEKRIKTATSPKATAAAVKSDFAGLAKSVSDSVGKAFDNSLFSRVDKSIQGFRSKLSGLPAAISGGLSKAAGIAKTAFGAITKGAVAVGAGLAVAGTAVFSFASLVTGAAWNLAKAALPMEGIRSAFSGLASTFQGGSQAMLSALQKSTAGMVTNTELMRQYNLAAQLVGQEFAQNLPAAVEPLQKVAEATGQDMGVLMNSLTVGIGRLSPMILDNLGVQVDLTQAYADFAAKNGLVASSLTKTQQQMALTEQVTQKLNENTANIPSTFGSAAQVFGAFKTSLANIKDQMGLDLLPTFTSLFSLFQKFTPLLSTFGSLFTGTFAGLGNVAKSFVSSFASGLGIDMENLGANMESWGSNIVTQLARGMAKAIGAVISVLNQLGQVIAGWLAPGSPPKLLPDLPAWGENATNWFLKGMTQGNVSILRDLSGQVESFLRSSMAGQSSQAIAKAVLSARGGIEAALAGGGNLMSSVPQQMQGYVGALVSSQQAAEKLAKAQENLNKITKQYDEQLKPITGRLKEIQAERDAFSQQQRIGELNQIITDATAAGDTDAVRFAQLELEEIALQNQQAAIEENKETAVNAAQEKVDAAQLEMDMAEKRLQLEQELLQHQIETNNLLADTIEKMSEMGGGAAGAIGGAAGAVESLSEAMSGIGNIAAPLGSTMSELAASIMGEFDGVAGAAGELGETWGGVVRGLGDRWNDFKTRLQNSRVIGWLTDLRLKWSTEVWPSMRTAIQTAWSGFIQPRLQDMWDWLSTEIPIALEILRQNWVDNVWPAIQTATTTAWDTIRTIFTDIGTWFSETAVPFLENLRAKWVDEVWPGIQTATVTAWAAISEVFIAIGEWFTTKIITPLLEMYLVWFERWEAIKTALTNVWLVISTVFNEIVRWIKVNIMPWVVLLAELWELKWNDIKSKLGLAWVAIETIWIAIKEWLDTTLTTALEFLQTTWDTIWGLVYTGFLIVWELIEPLWIKAQSWLEEWIPKALDALKETWDRVWNSFTAPVRIALDLVEKILGAAQRFWEWLSSKTFTFNFSIPDLPPALQTESPMKIHTAAKDFKRFLDQTTFDFDMKATGLENVGGNMIDHAALATAGNSQVNQPFNMYGNVSTGMSERELEAKVRRWIKEENRRR